MPFLKRVALIGSSGGGAATLSSSESIIESLRSQLRLITSSSRGSKDDTNTVDISDAVFVISNSGLDFASAHSEVSVWTSCDFNDFVRVGKGNLLSMNDLVLKETSRIAELIRDGEIQALISISCAPNGVNKEAVDAAISMGIPIVGTGGQSISFMATSGANVIGCSGGSVATTSSSRGICFAASLASYWRMSYDPQLRSVSQLFLKVQSIISAALPIMLSISLLKVLLASLHSTLLDNYIHIIDMNIKIVLPTIVTMISCSEYSNLKELSMMSGAAAGCMGQGGLLASIINGICCGELLLRLLVFCAKQSLLPTTSTIISIGLSAFISGVFTLLFQAGYSVVFSYFDNLFNYFTLDIVSLIAIGAALGVSDDRCYLNFEPNILFLFYMYN
jgi:hypothetical protein